MPGFLTHLVIGEQCEKRLPDCRLREQIKSCRVSFNYGLQGPDIFFYYPLTVLSNGGTNIGMLMHEGGTRKYFGVCLKALREMPDDKIRDYSAAYLAGFISHYLADAEIHPYIYARIGYDSANPRKKLHGSHARLEDDIDVLMMRRYRSAGPSELNYQRTMGYTTVEKAIMASYMSRTITDTYGDDPDKSRRCRLSYSTAGRVLAFFRKEAQLRPNPENCRGTRRQVLNLDHQKWHNSWDASIFSQESLPELIDRTFDKTLLAFELLDHCMDGDGEEALLNYLGNRSYHSGLELPEE